MWGLWSDYGPVFNHARLVAQGLPTVVAAQPQRVAVGHHQAVGVAEVANGVAVAVDHRAQLAVFVVAVLCERFNGLVVELSAKRAISPDCCRTFYSV